MRSVCAAGDADILSGNGWVVCDCDSDAVSDSDADADVDAQWQWEVKSR